MAKKLTKLGQAEDDQLADAVRTSAHQIWQAGLGAFVKAQQEGGHVFRDLVQEGTELQKRSRLLAEGEAADIVTREAEGVSRQAAGAWDKLEQVFEDRVARALATIGVPTQSDMRALIAQVEQLTRAVNELSAKRAAAATTAPLPGPAPARPRSRKTGSS